MAHPRLTGAIPTPRHKLLAARPHRIIKAPPPMFAVVPKQLSNWGNAQFGDCVSAEEAFAIACYAIMCGLPERFVLEATVIAWARQHGFLNGANLTDVMDAMARNGMVDSASNTDSDGPYTGVNFADEPTLQSAIATGPVKLGMGASALPSGAGNEQGWYAFGNHGGLNNEDHCTGLSGYGTAGYCFQQLGVPVPQGVDPNKPNCYLHFTWSTIGVVDHPWIMGTVGEAWLRNPTTVGLSPVPPIPPTPPVPPVPPPVPATLTIPSVPVFDPWTGRIHIGNTAPQVVPLPGGAQAVGPILHDIIIALEAVCAVVPNLPLPQPWGGILDFACMLVPKLKAAAPGSPEAINWLNILMSLLRFACANVALLQPYPQVYQAVTALCALLPPGGCGGCK